MNRLVKLTRLLVFVTGVIQIVLDFLVGIGVWNASSLVYILNRIVLILGLCTMTIIAAAARVKFDRVGDVIARGGIILILGIYQIIMISGMQAWVITAIDMLIVLSAIGHVDGLALMVLRKLDE